MSLFSDKRQAQGQKSWVYVIDNPSMPGMIKVGYTARHPKDRLEDRDYSVRTSMPTPYRIVFAVGVQGDRARRVEHAVHQRLPGRVTPPGVKGNEWFRCQATQAISIITKTAGKQQQPIAEYYNPHGMDIRHLPPPKACARTRDERHLSVSVLWVTAAAAVLVWLVWEPVAATLAWLGEVLTWELTWRAASEALTWLAGLVWEALTWLVWLAWEALTWIAWLVWEALTWLAWEVLTWLA